MDKMLNNHKINPKRLKRIRKFRRMTQAALEEASGVKRSYISQLENEKSGTDRQQPGTIEALADALACDPEYLTGDIKSFTKELENERTLEREAFKKRTWDKFVIANTKSFLNIYGLTLDFDPDSQRYTVRGPEGGVINVDNIDELTEAIMHLLTCGQDLIDLLLDGIEHYDILP